MVYDSARGKTVLFGGIVGLTVNGDTWEWDGFSWEQAAAEEEGLGPSARYRVAMAYDSTRGKTLLAHV